MVTFTQLPPVDIHQCIVNAVLFTQLTPPSLVQEILDPDSSRSPEALESLPVGHISFDEFLEIQNLSLLLDIRGSPSNPVNHVLGAILVQRPEQVTDLVHQHGHRFIGSFTILIYDQETEGKMKLIWEELRVIPRVLLLGLSEETTKRLILCSCSGGLLKDSRLISACSSFKE